MNHYNIHNIIKREYEKRQKSAFDNLLLKKSEVYSKIPRIDEIDTQIQHSGIKYNKMILSTEGSSHEAVRELTHIIDSLKKEKENLLIENGYYPSYLDMDYMCSQCKDTGFIEGVEQMEKCTCYKQLFIRHLYSQSNLQLTEIENFSTFDESFYPENIDENRYGISISPRKNILNIKERCLQFIQNFSSPDEKNLFFSGPTGVGKTFMSNCIALELFKKGHTVLYQTAPKLFDIINEYKKNSLKEDQYQDESYKSIFEVDLLIIDDLGTETQTAARYAELLNILNTRQMNNRSKPCKTLISTNISVKKLQEFYTERVYSRIVGSFEGFMFVGKDIRYVKNNS